MTIALVGENPIDWTRPVGCPAGFEPRQVVNGSSLFHADQFLRSVDVEPKPLKNID